MATFPWLNSQLGWKGCIFKSRHTNESSKREELDRACSRAWEEASTEVSQLEKAICGKILEASINEIGEENPRQ